MTTISPEHERGQIWRVRFDPSEGEEIQKTRPAAIIGLDKIGHKGLRIIVPITTWKERFTTEGRFWMIQLEPTSLNGLTNVSGADTSQIKSVSTNRFESYMGVLTADELEEIVAAIVLCIGYKG